MSNDQDRHDERRNRRDDAVTVAWDQRRRPAYFRWRGRRYAVDHVVRTWVIATEWWSEQRATDRVFWRVSAQGRLFDLSFDRLSGQCRLERVLN